MQWGGAACGGAAWATTLARVGEGEDPSAESSGLWDLVTRLVWTPGSEQGRLDWFESGTAGRGKGRVQVERAWGLRHARPVLAAAVLMGRS